MFVVWMVCSAMIVLSLMMGNYALAEAVTKAPFEGTSTVVANTVATMASLSTFAMLMSDQVVAQSLKNFRQVGIAESLVVGAVVDNACAQNSANAETTTTFSSYHPLGSQARTWGFTPSTCRTPFTCLLHVLALVVCNLRSFLACRPCKVSLTSRLCTIAL